MIIATAVMVKFRVRRMTITTEACFWEAILVHVTLTLPGAQFSDRQPNYTPDYQRILPVWEKSKGMLIISSYSISRSNPGLPHESSPCDFLSGIWMFTPTTNGSKPAYWVTFCGISVFFQAEEIMHRFITRHDQPIQHFNISCCDSSRSYIPSNVL